jgi:hypothetical protein
MLVGVPEDAIIALEIFQSGFYNCLVKKLLDFAFGFVHFFLQDVWLKVVA